MKIAVATERGMVCPHFGHCEGFTVYETEGKDVKSSSFVESPGHRPGFLPVFLHEQGVNVIIAGGMGAGAIEIFDEKGIEVVTGASGSTKDVVNQYVQGELKSSGSICNEHQHAGECGGH